MICSFVIVGWAYSSIKIEIAYDYNVNTVYFDGIQLFKEEFGNSYTYNDDGDVISVVDLQKQETTYEYDTSGNLTQIIQDNKAKMTYEYDQYHNVTKATTATGIVYEFEYDAFGNNTSVSIVNGDSRITSSATYSDDGNILLSTTDALAKVTQYGYNVDTNVLEWVQYPEDTPATRTEYDYDTMYRLASATADVDTGYSLDASYTYVDDLLTCIQTNSTSYSFIYGDFAQIAHISVGTRTLADYDYTDDANRYLEKLTYGNDDYVQYTYDSYGRVTQETFEDGDTVTYVYDNSGALATVTDSATGIKTTYYYDFTDRLMKYVESGTGYSHSVGYEFDSLNNLTKLVETINGVEHTTSYGYDSDNRIRSVSAGSVSQTVSYDAYGRLTQTITNHLVTNAYLYNGDSAQVGCHSVYTARNGFSSNYRYDRNGNIIAILPVSGINTTRYYHYDSANQLIREDNQAAGKTWVWAYDDAGNILSRTEYAYTTGLTLGDPVDVVEYVYGNENWGDLLTSYDDTTITYDGIGNPLTYGNTTYTWEHGRELSSLSDGTTTWTYTYDANGMRTMRTNGTTTYTYVYNGSQLTQMTVGENVLHFVYGANGEPIAVKLGTVPYCYMTNLQGDVVAITNPSGVMVVMYQYDAWGNIVSVTGSMASTLGVLNPLTYRGYVYDHETGLYYLQSRYYNPEWGRFINADAFVSTGGLLSNNMFSYCANNPVVFLDDQGTSYRAVGAGLQFEITVGSSTVGIEVICYWDVDECANGGVVIAAYAYCGFSFDMNDPLLGSIMATITDNSDLLANGTEAGVLALAALIGDTFSISVSGVLVTGTEDFTSTESYEGSFTSVDASWGKVKASYAYSENCQAYSIGGKVTGASLFPSWGISKTYYTQFYELGIGQPSVNNAPAMGGGGSISCIISVSSRVAFFAQCC